MNKAGIVVLATLLTACAQEARVEGSAAALSGDTPVPDTDSTSVMFFNTSGNKCTATMVGADPGSGTGWALTDRHCYAPTASGVLFESAAATVPDDATTYPYVGAALEMVFDETDLNLIEVSGVDADTPVMEMVDPCSDPVSVGSTVRVIAHGEPLDSGRAVRRSAAVTVDAIGPTKLFIDGEATTSACDRDQGGAVVVDGSSGPQLVGVITGPAACDGNIVANRVSPFVRSSIARRIDPAQPVVNIACFACTAIVMNRFECGGELSACQADGDCATALSDCAPRCPDEACLEACGAGNAQYAALYTCASGRCREGMLCDELCDGAGSTPDAGTGSGSADPDGDTSAGDAGASTTTDAGTASGMDEDDSVTSEGGDGSDEGAAGSGGAASEAGSDDGSTGGDGSDATSEEADGSGDASDGEGDGDGDGCSVGGSPSGTFLPIAIALLPWWRRRQGHRD